MNHEALALYFNKYHKALILYFPIYHEAMIIYTHFYTKLRRNTQFDSVASDNVSDTEFLSYVMGGNADTIPCFTNIRVHSGVLSSYILSQFSRLPTLQPALPERVRAEYVFRRIIEGGASWWERLRQLIGQGGS